MTKTMTEGKPAKLILFFTIPLLIGNLFQQFYSMADTFIVGRTIGVNALAAVGCTGSIMFLIIGFAQGFTSGLSIVIAQRFGAGDMKGVRQSFAVGLTLSLVATIVLTALSVSTARPILELMQTPPEIIDDAYSYIVVIFGGIGAAILFNLLSNVTRALGDSKTPLIFLIIACIINIALDLVFIINFNMGVAGAGWATIIAQLIAGICCLVFISKRFTLLKVTREDFRFPMSAVGHHLKIALPMAFQMSIIAIGAIMLQFALNGLGSVYVAAYTASQKIDTLAVQPMMSFGVTMATYTAQNYGAGDIARIKKGVIQCAMMSVSFSLIVGAINVFFGKMLVEVFVGGAEIEVINHAQTYLTINGSMYFILSLLFIFRYTLQGLGQSFIPTFAGLMELCMRGFAAVFLTSALGFAGACMANPLAWAGSCIPLAISFVITMKRLTITTPVPDVATE